MFEQGSILLTLWCSLVYYENESLMLREETFKVVFANFSHWAYKVEKELQYYVILTPVPWHTNHAMRGKLLALINCTPTKSNYLLDDIKAFICTFTRYIAKNNHIVKSSDITLYFLQKHALIPWVWKLNKIY